MIGMVLDAEQVMDHLGDTLGRPQFGGKAMCARTRLERPLELLQVLPVESCWASGFSSLLQSRLAALRPSLLPTTGRLAGDAALARYLGWSPSLVKQTGGLEASALQLIEVSFLAFRKSHIA